MRSFSKKLAFVLAAAMVVTAFAPAAKAEAAKEMEINAKGKILYVTDGEGINDAAQVGGGKGNVAEYDFYVKNKPDNWKKDYSFEWKSSNDKIITVGKGGLTTAVAVGEADVICVVTEKATGTKTTLTNTVTVKANAAEVEIINAEDWDGETVEAGTVVDLNRKMTDAAGNETTKRGEYVTDKTKWVAEPATGVKVTQSNGKFEFTEEAVPGDYTLYCYTYQSDKYKAATATSEKIVVTYVADKTFEVKQDSITQFTVNFDKPVKTLSVADVSVIRMFSNYEYPMQVKSVALAADGLSAAVTVFNSFADKVDYIIKVKGYEDETLTASVGRPVRMEVIAVDANGAPKNPTFLLTTGVASGLVCKFYDAKEVDVTPTVTENVSFRLEKLATNGDYYLAGKSLTIKKSTAAPVVIAEYPGWFENGKRVGAFSQPQQFFAEDAAPVVPVAVKDYTVNVGKYGPEFYGDNKTMQKSNSKQLYVKIQRSDNGWDDTAYTNNSSIALGTNGSITFTALNPDIAVVSSTGMLTAFKPGTASFYVNFKSLNNTTKAYDEVPFAVVSVEVKADSYISYVAVNNESVTVGTADDFCTDTIKLVGFDQYNAANDITTGSATYTVECLSDGFTNKAAFGQVLTAALGDGLQNGDWGAKCVNININAKDLAAKLTKDEALDPGEAITLYFKITYKTPWATLSDEFAVTIQEPSDDKDNYVQIMPSTSYIDVLRIDEQNTNGEKDITFDVFYMNNGVKVDKFNFQSYPASGAAVAVKDKYYFKILKDGQDFYGEKKFTENTNTVTVYPSKENTLTGRVTNAVTGSVIAYEGAGTYTFALFKCYEENGEKTLLQEFASDIVVVVGDAGTYYIAGDQRANYVEDVAPTTNNAYSKDDAAKILKCFTINDRKGNSILGSDGKIKTDLKFDAYYVDYTAATGTNYVYVKDVTFYEEVGAGEYVAYTVAIDVALDNRVTTK